LKAALPIANLSSWHWPAPAAGRFVTYLNRVAEAMTGWTWQAALGQPLTEVFNIIDGATRELALNPAQRAVKEDRTGLPTSHLELELTQIILMQDADAAASLL